jgi:hypothetical protein
MAKETVQHKHGSQARPYVSFTRKYNLGNYQSMDISVGLSDDCSEENEETPQEGIQRVAKLVQAEFEALCEKIEGRQKTGGKK